MVTETRAQASRNSLHTHSIRTSKMSTSMCASWQMHPTALLSHRKEKVLVLQLLQRPRCRAGVSVTVERDGVKQQQEAEPRKPKAPSTIIRPNVTPLYGDWWYIIKVSADNEMSNVAKSWAVSGISAVVVHAVWALSTQTPVFLERF